MTMIIVVILVIMTTIIISCFLLLSYLNIIGVICFLIQRNSLHSVPRPEIQCHPLNQNYNYHHYQNNNYYCCHHTHQNYHYPHSQSCLIGIKLSRIMLIYHIYYYICTSVNDLDLQRTLCLVP